MDLAACAKRVFITLEHTTKEGGPRLLKRCALPITAPGVVKLVVTDLGLFEVTPEGFKLREHAPGWTPAEIQERHRSQTGHRRRPAGSFRFRARALVRGRATSVTSRRRPPPYAPSASTPRCSAGAVDPRCRGSTAREAQELGDEIVGAAAPGNAPGAGDRLDAALHHLLHVRVGLLAGEAHGLRQVAGPDEVHINPRHGDQLRQSSRWPLLLRASGTPASERLASLA